MLRRVLKRKQADRALWVTLFLLTLFGVGVAIKLSLNAERESRWSGGAPPASELEENPLAARVGRADSGAAPPRESLGSVPVEPDSTPPGPAPPAPLPAKQPPPQPGLTTAPPLLVVQQLTTPLDLKVAAMTPSCRSAIQARGPWLDRRTARPWPECLDDQGIAMVVQLCTYSRLATGQWVLSENSRTVPRCQAELPLVREGKLRRLDRR
jgi:hypothetical protein